MTIRRAPSPTLRISLARVPAVILRRLALASALALLFPGSMLAQHAETAPEPRMVRKSIEARPAGRIAVSILSGHLRVEGWERDEVAIEAELGAAVEELEIFTDGQRIDVQPVVSNEERHGAGAAVDLRVWLPAASKLEARTVAGSMSIVGARGHLELETVAGSVEVLEGNPREVLLTTATGRVRLAAPVGRARVRTASGAVRVEQAVDDLAIVTATGDQTVLAPLVLETRLETVSGRVIFEGELGRRGRMLVRSHDGTTELRLPGSLAADLDLRTRRGALSGDFEAVLASATGGDLVARAGGGGARIEVESLEGDILVLRQAGLSAREPGSGAGTASGSR